jgi:cytochrome c-type biogenesis protein CcmH
MRLTVLFSAVLAALVLCCAPARADEARPLAEDPVVEARLVGIAEELRCLVCQNESLAGSRSELAQDLRRQVREQIRQGKTDQEVVDYLVARYGDFVRYRPAFKPATWLLWLGPFAFLVAGLAGLAVFLRSRRPTPPLSDAERALAAALLQDKD